MNNDLKHSKRRPTPPHRYIEPGPGQESVWDYPRPPMIDPDDRLVKVIFKDIIIAQTKRAVRVLETAQPPAFYIPADDVNMKYLRQTPHHTVCEWKGLASYYSVEVGTHIAERAAWSYHDPVPQYHAIKHYVAFYPQRVDACYIDDERVESQPGNFYGGWITSEIVGPFKGAPGTLHW